MKKLIRHMVSSERVLADWGVRMDVDEVFPLVERNNFGGAFEAVMTAWCRRNHKPRWGEKTPQNAHYGRDLVDFFPSANYVHIIRDGRDVALSLAKTPFGPKSSYHAARYWSLYLNEIEEIERRLPAKQFCTLRYEDLLTVPGKVLSDLCHFLDEEYDERMLHFFHGHTPDNIEMTNRLNLQKPLDASNTYKWKKNMPESDVNVFEYIAGKKLEDSGYERVFASPSLSMPEYMMKRYVGYWPQRISGMFLNRKAQREFLFRLRNRINLFLS